MKKRSKIIRNKNFHWEDVESKLYKTQGSNFKDITRYSLLGEAEDEWELNFQTRYFEIKPGGYSSLEFHRHPHSVIIIRGKGSMILGDEVHDLHLHDVVFISPETLHQFHADKGEELGFICVVDRYRDKPGVPNQEMLDSQLGNSETRKKCKI